MENEDRNSGKDRIRNEGQNRDGGIAYIYELHTNTGDSAVRTPAYERQTCGFTTNFFPLRSNSCIFAEKILTVRKDIKNRIYGFRISI